MSLPQKALTYESVLKLIQKTSREMRRHFREKKQMSADTDCGSLNAF